jgi:thiol-disulfide isomerase/thioredoxin
MKFLYTAFFAALLLFTGCEEKNVLPVSDELGVGDVVELTSVTGAKLKFKRVEGGIVQVGAENKTVIFDIFGTFCEPCKREAPALMNLQRKYLDEVTLVGLSYFEDVDESHIINDFIKPYNARYFIVKNSPKNKAIVDTIVEDIKYPDLISLPFKVVIKAGKYQTLTDVWDNKTGLKYYIGDIGTQTIENDLKRIL